MVGAGGDDSDWDCELVVCVSDGLVWVGIADNSAATGYLRTMNFDPMIRLCETVGSTSRAAGSYKPP